MPKISIITATYNRGYVLKNCLDSIRSQTYNSLEHIVIDGLSSDDTENIINDYKNQVNYPVTYIKEKDKGIYDALNKGILLAKGEWIHFLHSDDFYLNSNSLSSIFNTDGINWHDLLVCTVLQGEKLNTNVLSIVPTYDEVHNLYKFPHTGTIFKKTVFEKYGLYSTKMKIASDTLFNVKYYKHLNYKIIDHSLLFMSSKGISSNYSSRYVLEVFIVYCIYSKTSYKIKKKHFDWLLYALKKELRWRVKNILQRLK